jgi:hypothetical protein
MSIGTVYILTLYIIMINFESFSHSFASLVSLSLLIRNTSSDTHALQSLPRYRQRKGEFATSSMELRQSNSSKKFAEDSPTRNRRLRCLSCDSGWFASPLPWNYRRWPPCRGQALTLPGKTIKRNPDSASLWICWDATSNPKDDTKRASGVLDSPKL